MLILSQQHNIKDVIMATKIRLSGDDTAPVVETTALAESPAESPAESTALTPAQVEQLMKYVEAMDWKLWEILKIMRKHTGE
jgi:hypothetical protein